ncbi:MAG: hybrid sensor histidine kinase/response regulator [Syntrophorhabdaceae bacterium]
MRTQSRILFGVISSLVASIVIALIAFSALHTTNTELKRIETFTDIVNKAHALQLLITSFEEASGWADVRKVRTMIQSLHGLLEKPQSQEPGENILIAQLQKSDQELQLLMDQILVSGQGDTAAVEKERRSLLITQARIKVQFISDDAGQLMDISQSRIVSAQEKAGTLVIILIIILGVSNGGIYLLSLSGILRAQKELQRSEQRWATTLSSIGDAVIATDRAGNITFMNGAAEELTGWTNSEVALRPVAGVFNIINEETRKEVESPIAKVIREGKIVGLPNHTILIKKDGTEIPIDDSGAPIIDKGGKTTGVVIVFRDRTERKYMEEALRQSEQQYRIMGETVPYGVWLADPNGGALYASQSFLDLLEMTQEEQQQFGWTHRLPPEDVEPMMKKWMHCIQTGEPWDSEHRILGPDGKYHTVLTRGLPVRNEEGEITCWVGINLDIDERKSMEKELHKSRDELEHRVQERTFQLQEAYESLQRETKERQKAEEQLRQSQKMEAIGTLAGGIAHDFNNILAAIMGFTEMAIDDHADCLPVEKSLQNIHKSTLRARDLVKQILAFSRKTTYERAPLSLTPITKETVQFLRASIPANIEIKLSIISTSDTIVAAPTEVQQILMNLAANASLAMEEKGGILEIHLTDFNVLPESPGFESDLVPGEYVRLMVKDTGTGMGPEVIERAFEPFFTTRELGAGTGMGLAVVYGIVTDLKGTITVESEPGIGSAFRVFLPKVKAEVKEEDIGPLHIPTGTESILFVDDEDMLVVWAKATLEKLGYRVTALTDPDEALETFSTELSHFDLVITDQTMPSMSGMDFAQKLLTIRPNIPVILCTGHSVTASLETAQKAGIKGFLMKPIARQELARVIRHALDETGEK